MLTHLTVRNFRGFREFSTSIGPVTAFLGPNSSGKTTALQAVRLACDLVQLGLELEGACRLLELAGERWVSVSNGKLVGDPVRLLPLADWRALFLDQVATEGSSFQIQLDFEKADPVSVLFVEVARARNEQLKLEVRLKSQEAVELVAGLPIKSQQINQRLTALVRDFVPLAVLVPPFYGTVRQEEYRVSRVTDRLLGSGDQSRAWVTSLIAVQRVSSSRPGRRGRRFRGGRLR